MSRRVLMVQHSANRDGSAFSALLLANGFREAGWDTHVAFAFHGPIITDFQASGHSVRIVPHKSWLRTTQHLYFIRNLIREVQAASHLVRVIDELQPDLIYVNSCVSLAGSLAAKWQGKPCIWHLRELFEDVGGEMKVPAGLRPMVRWIIRTCATRLIANSKAVVLNMMGDADEKRVEIVPNAAGERFFSYAASQGIARQALGLPQEGTIVGVPGTLRPMKGHPFFFRAVQALAMSHPDLIIAVTGSGKPDYERELAALVEALGLEAQVRFLGSIEAMPAFYRACDIACVPSRAEPFGRTVIEAFAMGVPIVATAVGGIRETVTDGETGLLVQYGNEAELAAALERMLVDADLRERLRRRARREAEQRYHETVYQERINSIVGALCPSVRYSNRVPLSPATYPGVAHDEL